MQLKAGPAQARSKPYLLLFHLKQSDSVSEQFDVFLGALLALALFGQCACQTFCLAGLHAVLVFLGVDVRLVNILCRFC